MIDLCVQIPLTVLSVTTRVFTVGAAEISLGAKGESRADASSKFAGGYAQRH